MSADRALQLLMLAVFSVMLVTASQLSLAAAVAPVVAASVGIVFVLVVAFATPVQASRRPVERAQVAGFFALLAAVGLFGLIYGGALGILFHLRLLARLRWWQALAGALGWVLVAEVVFDTWLRGQLPRGLLSTLL